MWLPSAPGTSHQIYFKAIKNAGHVGQGRRADKRISQFNLELARAGTRTNEARRCKHPSKAACASVNFKAPCRILFLVRVISTAMRLPTAMKRVFPGADKKPAGRFIVMPPARVSKSAWPSGRFAGSNSPGRASRPATMKPPPRVRARWQLPAKRLIQRRSFCLLIFRCDVRLLAGDDPVQIFAVC